MQSFKFSPTEIFDSLKHSLIKKLNVEAQREIDKIIDELRKKVQETTFEYIVELVQSMKIQGGIASPDYTVSINFSPKEKD